MMGENKENLKGYTREELEKGVTVLDKSEEDGIYKVKDEKPEKR